MFLFFAFAGTLVANIGATESAGNTTTNDTVGFSPIVLMYVAVSFGFSLMVNVWIFFRVSGGLFSKRPFPSFFPHKDTADTNQQTRQSLSGW